MYVKSNKMPQVKIKYYMLATWSVHLSISRTKTTQSSLILIQELCPHKILTNSNGTNNHTYNSASLTWAHIRPTASPGWAMDWTTFRLTADLKASGFRFWDNWETTWKQGNRKDKEIVGQLKRLSIYTTMFLYVTKNFPQAGIPNIIRFATLSEWN